MLITSGARAKTSSAATRTMYSMPLDYFIWAIKNDQRIFVLDTGFDLDIAEKRKRQIVRHPAEGLKAIGIDPADVEDVIISHMHYDHCGNHALFPKARYHLQESEMQYCTGRYMCHGAMRIPFEPDDVVAMVRRALRRRRAIPQRHRRAGARV